MISSPSSFYSPLHAFLSLLVGESLSPYQSFFLCRYIHFRKSLRVMFLCSSSFQYLSSFLPSPPPPPLKNVCQRQAQEYHDLHLKKVNKKKKKKRSEVYTVSFKGIHLHIRLISLSVCYIYLTITDTVFFTCDSCDSILKDSSCQNGTILYADHCI